MPEKGRLISLDHPTTPGLTPLRVVALAHELDCDAVSLRMRFHPSYDSDRYDLIDDQRLRKQIRSEVSARSMFIALGSGLEVRAGVPVASLAPTLEAAAEIGARGVSVVIYDTDRISHFDRLSELAELSSRAGVRSLIEVFALSGLDSFEYATELLREIGHPALGLSVDSLHVARTGAKISEIASAPVGLIGHAQLNDGPSEMPPDKQLDEARGERLLPGEGVFDLLNLVRALPEDVTIGVEAGSRAAFARGVTMEQRGRAAVLAMRQVIALALES
jgi:sugar phosphate isomerase/epimerase